MSSMIQKIDFYLIYKKYKNNFFFSILMGFFSFFYNIGYKTRLFLYKNSYLKGVKFDVPVISIGNITTGGTGKTPLTIEIGKHLIKKGLKVGVLSRGYKRVSDINENVLVSDGNEILADYEICGDEPYLIAKTLRKAIMLAGANRVKSAYSAIRLGANVLILDDGYQHLKINRDLDILLLDSNKPFDNGHTLPKGELREDIDSIKRATSIIFTNSSNFTTDEFYLNKVKQINPSAPIFYMKYEIKNLRGINIKKSISINEAKANKYISFCGIGNPEGFTESLSAAGLNVIENISFPDHHNYDYSDIKKILEVAKKQNVQDIITTEKDAVKLEDLCMAAPVTFWYSEIEIRWKDAESLELLTNDVIARHV